MQRFFSALSIAVALLADTEVNAQTPRACDPSKFRTVLDVGHTRTAPGATSARGVKEFEFNRQLAEAVREALVGKGFASTFVLIISGDGSHAELLGRVARENSLRPDLLLSLHHDSVQPRYLQPWTVNGKQQLYSDRFSGYSIFVSNANPYPAESLRFAKLLGTELVARGMRFSKHHAEPIEGEGRAVIDPLAGIYLFNGLTVLSYARAPAALLESGLIVNRQEELVLSSPSTRAAIASAITSAVTNFCASR
jgi:N-acetylmuramoyl-L-alanine amidase